MRTVYLQFSSHTDNELVFNWCPCGQLTARKMKREISKAEHTGVETENTTKSKA